MSEVIEKNVRSKGAEGEGEGSQSEPPRPEWLPEKFKSPEELAKAYAEAEKKLGSGKPSLEMQSTSADDANRQVADAGLDFNALAAEVAQSGSLSEESLKSLESKGIPRNVAESFVEGQKARADKMRSALADVAGGEETLNKMVAWGAANYSKEELAAYNDAVKSNNPALARLAVEGLKARFTAAVGSDGERITGAPKGDASGVKPFESAQQMSEAMRSPKYARDPAYRNEVKARIKVSPRFFGR